jgi:histidine triad (HIT) family protein
MSSVFTRILAGEIPGRFVWKDDRAFVILTARPIRPGHALVIPRAEVDHWIDLEPSLNAHLFEVARKVGQGLQRAFSPTKVGMAIVGLEVRHVHLHLVPMWGPEDLDFARQDPNPAPADLDAAAVKIRQSFRALGYPEVVD